MSDGAPAGPDPGEEARYRRVAAVDLSSSAGLPQLLEALADPSWRVRQAAVQRLEAHPRPAEAAEALAERMTGGPTPGCRSAAAAALAGLGGSAVPAVTRRLGADRAEVRTAAAEVAGEIGDRRALPPLLGLLGDPDENVRAAAAEALGKIGGGEAAEALLGCLGGGDRALELAALEALERLGAAPPVERLEALAAERVLRRPVYRLAGLSRGPAAFALVARGLGERARGAREAALCAVGRMRFRLSPPEMGSLAEAVRQALPRSAGQWVAEALGSEDRAAAAGALLVLGWIGDPSHAPAVAAAADAEELAPLVPEVLEAMGPAAGEALRSRLPRLQPEARAAALASLARGGEARALPALAELASEPDDRSREAAVAALARLGGPGAVAALSELLGGPDPDAAAAAAQALAAAAARGGADRSEALARTRGAASAGAPVALRLLGRLGDEGDLGEIRRSLRARDPRARAAAAGAIEELAGRGYAAGCVPELVDALDDAVAEVRAAAARAMGAAADPRRAGPRAAPLSSEGLREVRAALRDGDPAVRAAAAAALGRLGGPGAAAALAEALEDGEAAVAAAAARALGETGCADLGVLARAAAHPDPEVVKEALEAAARTPGAGSTQLLLEAISHPRWDVRAAAARALAARGDRSALAALRARAASEEDPLAARALAAAAEALEGPRGG